MGAMFELTTGAAPSFSASVYVDLMIAAGREPIATYNIDTSQWSYWERASNRMSEADEQVAFNCWHQANAQPDLYDLVIAECLRRGLIG